MDPVASQSPAVGGRSKLFSTLLGLLVSAAVIVWMVYAIEWSEVASQLAESHYLLLIPVTVVYMGHFALRALRWRYLLPDEPPQDRVSLKRLLDALMLGNFANYILPLRAGEFIRPFVLSQDSRHSFSTGLVSVVIERFFDLSFVLLSFVVMVFFVPDVPPIVQQGASVLSVLAVGLLAFMLVGTLMPQTAEKIIDYFIDFFPARVRVPLKKFCHDFIEGAAVLGQKGRMLKVLLLTIAVWLSSYFVMYLYLFVYAAPPHPAAQSVWLAIALGVVVALAVAAPSAPGFIGVYQAGCIASFALFGIEKEAGAAFAILTHVYQYVLFCAYGVYCILSGSISLGDLRSAAARSSPS